MTSCPPFSFMAYDDCPGVKFCFLFSDCSALLLYMSQPHSTVTLPGIPRGATGTAPHPPPPRKALASPALQRAEPGAGNAAHHTCVVPAASPCLWRQLRGQGSEL
eukprot:EG_transcript_7237